MIDFYFAPCHPEVVRAAVRLTESLWYDEACGFAPRGEDRAVAHARLLPFVLAYHGGDGVSDLQARLWTSSLLERACQFGSPSCWPRGGFAAWYARRLMGGK